MDISLIMKILGIGLIVAIAAQMLSKSGRDEQATYVTIAGIVVTLLVLVEEIGVLFDTVKDVFGL
jgi:stage III sporulation protein AC